VFPRISPVWGAILEYVGLDLVGESEQLLEEAVSLRRAIHSAPELGLELPATQGLIVNSLEALGLAVHKGERVSSVTTIIDGTEPGPTILLRADMDALPLKEDTGLDFASNVEGKMHACGHDAHVAMLLAAAQLLVRHRGELSGRVVLMFQPGEEGFAGARSMIEEGLLERYGSIDRAHALHITPVFDSGVIATRPGTLMASSDAFKVTVTGRGGHASTPADAVDPVPVACELVMALQAMVTRRVSVFDPGVLTIGSISAGTTTNVIPEKAVILGTIRAVSEATRAQILEGLSRVSEHVAAAHGCTSLIDQVAVSYPVTVNAESESERMLAVAERLLGADRRMRMPSPVMGAEDWSFVMQKLPGAMAFLGAKPAGDGPVAPNHSNRMMIDESAMAAGIALHAALALAG
jgi:amidohydrolase